LRAQEATIVWNYLGVAISYSRGARATYILNMKVKLYSDENNE
jgi:hypothetical protein